MKLRVKKYIKKPLVSMAKRYPIFRQARLWYISVRSFFLFYFLNDTNSKQVVFESYMGRAYACSPKAIYEAMLADKRFAEYTFIWAFKKPDNYAFLLKNDRTHVVKQRSHKYYKIYGKSGWWVTNAILPLIIKKKDDQKMLQCWHGTPLKLLRNDLKTDYNAALNTYEDMLRKNNSDTVRYDALISPSRFVTERFTSAFGLKNLKKDNIIIEQGYPRNDFLHNHTKADTRRIKKNLKIPAGKKVLLYAPTWRDNQHESGVGYTHKSSVDFDFLRNKLGKDWVILFRSHYLIANEFNFEKYRNFIIDASQHDDINELYIVSDVLMTDYSSVLFDYANLMRPMIFFMYDLEAYRDKLRGFYIDINTLPGDIVKKEIDIIKILNNLKGYNKKHKAAYRSFNNTYTYLDDGKATQRVIEAFFFDGERSKTHEENLDIWNV